MSRARHPRGAQIAALTPIVRRLHLQELQRIRSDAVRLAAENERLRDEVWDAHGRADMFHAALMQAEDIEFSLTIGGQLLVAPGDAA